MRTFTNKLGSRLPFFVFLLILAYPTLACGRLSMTASGLHFHHRRPPIILLTGFGPFGRNKVNSSWEAIRQLDGANIGEGHIVAVLLPVSWRQAGRLMREAIDKYHPVAVINVGQGNWRGVELITSAYNIIGHIPDNEGFKPEEVTILENGAFSYTTSLPVDQLVGLLNDAHIEARVGKTSGNYLCNFVNYYSYAHLEKVAPHTLAIFIHVPGIATATTEADQQTIKHLSDALHIISSAVIELAANDSQTQVQ